MRASPFNPSRASAKKLAISASVFLALFALTPRPAHSATADSRVAAGKYLVDLGGCASCHTATGGKPFAGGLYMDTPYGPISTSNITPDRQTGIGAWTDDEFYKALHDGIGKNGTLLYPVMPFPYYTKLSRDDVSNIRAYLATLPAVNQKRPPNKLRFPFSIRTSLLAWRTVFFKAGEFTPMQDQSPQINRGAYLVEGLAHCGECHNSRPVAGQSKFSKAFQGGVIDNWYAPNITGDARDGIGAWTTDQLATYLKTGAAPGKGVALGPMAETVENLSHASDADLAAMADYLKSTKPTADTHEKLAIFQGRDAQGANLYLNYCASCHGVDAKGVKGYVPALQDNGAVTASGPQNVIQVVLGGLEARGTHAPMPAVGAAMSDEEIAEVTNFVRQSGQNSAPATAAPGMVGALRDKSDTLMNGYAKTGCPAPSDAPMQTAAQKVGLAGRLSAMNEADMVSVAHQVVIQLRRANPHLKQDALINGVTQNYCTTLAKNSALDEATRAELLGEFSGLVYLEAIGSVAVAR